jgi:cyclophilin family peptidyl-prolyl cis-trans isomerase
MLKIEIRKLLSLFFFLSLLGLLVTGCENNQTTNQPTPGNTTPAPSTPSDKVDDEVAILETDVGRIVIEFFPGDAPKHVENFKKLTKEGFYDGVAFHRIIPGVIIQGGDPNSKNGSPDTWGMGSPDQATVPAEFNARKHVRGIVSAARRGNDINSATSQFFICEGPKPEWNGQYTVYGRVIEGMNVVGIISNSPTTPGTERPSEKITIKKASLGKRSDFGPTPEYK